MKFCSFFSLPGSLILFAVIFQKLFLPSHKLECFFPSWPPCRFSLFSTWSYLLCLCDWWKKFWKHWANPHGGQTTSHKVLQFFGVRWCWSWSSYQYLHWQVQWDLLEMLCHWSVIHYEVWMKDMETLYPSCVDTRHAWMTLTFHCCILLHLLFIRELTFRLTALLRTHWKIH